QTRKGVCRPPESPRAHRGPAGNGEAATPSAWPPRGVGCSQREIRLPLVGPLRSSSAQAQSRYHHHGALAGRTSRKNVESVASRALGSPTWTHLMADHFKAIADAIQKGYAIPAPSLEDLARYAALDAAIERMLFAELRRRMTSQQKRLHGFLVQVS